MFLGKAPAQTSVNSTRSLSCHSPACVIKEQDAVYWPVNSLPVSPAHSQKPGLGTQPRDPGRPGSAFHSHRRVVLGGHCARLEEHRAGLHSAPLQTFQSGKPAPCPATVPAWSTERVCTLSPCKISRAEREARALPGHFPCLEEAQRGFALFPTVNFPEREAHALPVHCPCPEHREGLDSAPL